MNKLAFYVPVVVAENDDIAMKEGEKYSMWLFDKGLKVRPEFFVPPGYMSHEPHGLRASAACSYP